MELLRKNIYNLNYYNSNLENRFFVCFNLTLILSNFLFNSKKTNFPLNKFISNTKAHIFFEI